MREGTPYSCLMLKNQRFSSLFRHYAKHHGLRKEDLEYCFTELLQNDDTPESVFLQARDEVIVRRRRSAVAEDPHELDHDAICPKEDFIEHFAALQYDETHADVTIWAGKLKVKVPVHKVVLVARSDYFKNMFSTSMKEGNTAEVIISSHDHETVMRMLEFIYSNKVSELSHCSAEQLTSTIAIADVSARTDNAVNIGTMKSAGPCSNCLSTSWFSLSHMQEYCLFSLKKLCEYAARDVINASNVVTLLAAAARYSAGVLTEACMRFLRKNMSKAIEDPCFREEISQYPNLVLDILRAVGDGGGSAEMENGGSSSSSSKRRRIELDVSDDERRSS